MWNEKGRFPLASRRHVSFLEFMSSGKRTLILAQFLDLLRYKHNFPDTIAADRSGFSRRGFRQYYWLLTKMFCRFSTAVSVD